MFESRFITPEGEWFMFSLGGSAGMHTVKDFEVGKESYSLQAKCLNPLKLCSCLFYFVFFVP